MHLKTKQKGVALITAMIITTIAVSLAGTLMYRQQLQIRLSSNISHLEQAYFYVNGMEDWAGTILLKSFKDNKEKYVSLNDDWHANGQLITFPIDGGTLNGQLIDLQGRINVNLLNRPKPKPAENNNQNQIQSTVLNQFAGFKQEQEKAQKTKPDIANINRLRLQNLIKKIDPDQEIGPPENFTDILKDWIDSDQTNGNISQLTGDEISSSGAESDYYQSLDPAYFSANTEMVSTTELRLLKDMKKNIYLELQKYVSTLPITDATGKKNIETTLNVNTADEKVLATLGFPKDIIEEILKEREITPFESKELFLSFIEGLNEDRKDYETDIDVTSSYFLLKGRVTIINASIPVNSILERKDGRISVIMRDFSVQ